MILQYFFMKKNGSTSNRSTKTNISVPSGIAIRLCFNTTFRFQKSVINTFPLTLSRFVVSSALTPSVNYIGACPLAICRLCESIFHTFVISWPT